MRKLVECLRSSVSNLMCLRFRLIAFNVSNTLPILNFRTTQVNITPINQQQQKSIDNNITIIKRNWMSVKSMKPTSSMAAGSSVLRFFSSYAHSLHWPQISSLDCLMLIKYASINGLFVSHGNLQCGQLCRQFCKEPWLTYKLTNHKPDYSDDRDYGLLLDSYGVKAAMSSN